mmetsp:Transcript_9895/g.19002  ORF Transcript_9895/g.19002 Transcript_9895/m.19002 type:complete len:217 (-) Transcript_9895:1533-2183(-)
MFRISKAFSSTLAPWSRSSLTTFVFGMFFSRAMCRGVRPSESLLLTDAPCERSSSRTVALSVVAAIATKGAASSIFASNSPSFKRTIAAAFSICAIEAPRARMPSVLWALHPSRTCMQATFPKWAAVSSGPHPFLSFALISSGFLANIASTTSAQPFSHAQIMGGASCSPDKGTSHSPVSSSRFRNSESVMSLNSGVFRSFMAVSINDFMPTSWYD